MMLHQPIYHQDAVKVATRPNCAMQQKMAVGRESWVVFHFYFRF
jgi:hypothetical protein